MKRRRSILLVLALGLAAIAMTGCTAARNGLGTHVSSCFRVLPAAQAAAGTSATFDGVRLLPGDALIRTVSDVTKGRPALPDHLTDVSHEATCLVAFRGAFSLASVSRGWAPAPGPYVDAIVVMRQSSGDLVATVLLRRLPRAIRFFHR
jgi:hypothetical protein